MPRNPSPSTPQDPAPAAAAAQSLVQSFVAVLVRPAAFFESIRSQTGLGAPIVFAAVMGAVAGVLRAVFAILGVGTGLGVLAGLGAIVIMPVVAVVLGSFVGGAIVHVIALVAGGKGTFEQSVRVSSYSMAVMPIVALAGLVPLLDVVPQIYGLYLVVLGIVAIHTADRKRAFVVAGILAGLLVLITVAGLFTARAAKSAAADMEAKYGEGSEFQKEMQRSTQELQKAVEAAQRAAEQQQKERESGK